MDTVHKTNSVNMNNESSFTLASLSQLLGKVAHRVYDGIILSRETAVANDRRPL